MKYFLHYTDTFNDEKVSELFMHHGYEGLGLYYVILEKIASAEKPIKTSVLKHQLKVGKKLEKIWKFMESLEIISSNNGETFEEKCLNNAEKYKKKSEKNAKRVAQFRENQDVAKNVMHYTDECNDDKLNKSKVNTINTINSKANISRFAPPSQEMVQDYAIEISKGSINAPEDFVNYYSSNGWKVGKNHMKDWKASYRNWTKNEKQYEAVKGVNQYRAETKSERNERLYRDFGKELNGGKPLPDIFELCKDQ